MKQRILYFLTNPARIFTVLITRLPYFSFIRNTNDYQCRVNFSMWFRQKVFNLGENRAAYWPVHPTSQVFDAENIKVGVDAYPGYMKGCYIQGKGGIEIGDYTQIAPNVVIVSANHDMYDTRKHIPAPVRIGKYCWIGAGAKIMPGVVLGDYTIVGAGAVVTHSYPDGYTVIGGVPARPLKTLDKEKCVLYEVEKRYHGYLTESQFQKKFERR